MDNTLLGIVAAELGLVVAMLGFLITVFVVSAVKPAKQDPLLAFINQQHAAAAEAKASGANNPETPDGKVEAPGMYA